MARFADRIPDLKWSVPVWHPEDVRAMQPEFLSALSKALPTAVCIDLENVAEYHVTLGDNDEGFRYEDYPCLMSPFPVFWAEHSMKPLRKAEPQIADRWPDSVGFLATGKPADQFGKGEERLLQMVSDPGDRCRVASCLTVRGFLERDGTVCFYASWEILLDSLGRPMETYAWVPGVGDTEVRERSELGLISHFIHSSFHTLGLAMGFMHCKNVRVLPADPAPERLARAYRRRKKRDLISYHVLSIEPMKTAIRKESGGEAVGLKKALHICRGHFADYSDGKGLFGRYHGRYWVPAHVRGSMGKGMAAKDYAIKAEGNR